MKTIKQIADELGVSKQAVFKKMKREPLSTSLQGLMSTVDGRLMVSVDGERAIKQAFLENRPSTKTVNQNTSGLQLVDGSQTIINVLKAELEVKNAQIKEKDMQIEKLQVMNDNLQEENRKLSSQLLDLSGKVSESLQAIAKTQLADKMIEGRKMVSEELDPENSEEEKKGFLSRFFKK